MTVTHWIERGVGWLMGVIVPEMTKPLFRDAWALAKGWLERVWGALLKEKAMTAKETISTVLGNIQLLHRETPKGDAFGMAFCPDPSGMEPEARNVSMVWHDDVERLAERAASLPISKNLIVDAFRKLGSSGYASIPVRLSLNEIHKHRLESTLRLKGRI